MQRLVPFVERAKVVNAMAPIVALGAANVVAYRRAPIDRKCMALSNIPNASRRWFPLPTFDAPHEPYCAASLQTMVRAPEVEWRLSWRLNNLRGENLLCFYDSVREQVKRANMASKNVSLSEIMPMPCAGRSRSDVS